ncbi:MAG TPA: winged helix-turn-helix domain-containing protein [Stellaceae bacterium]|nr:winged helix-turn-helix domain-containing protein [Stellaceae bacterium]
MGASTIVIAREDLSIPGAADPVNGGNGAADVETYFFKMMQQANPDVVVLDLTETQGNGTGAILKVRRGCNVPILVVCTAADPLRREYCLAGAAECMQAPVDLMQLNRTVQQIIQLSRESRPAAAAEPSPAQTRSLCFSGLTLLPHENTLVGADGANIKLTTSENRVLLHFVNNPWILCTRDSLADALYGAHRPSSDRAVDVIVTRLRKKIAALGGPAAHRLIKTEFRRGYVFIPEVSAAEAAARQSTPPLQARSA